MTAMRTPRRAERPFDRDQWIMAARAKLIAGGVGQVRIEALAREMGITPGSFYWHFKDKADLLAALREDWERSNSAPLFAAVAAAPREPAAMLDALMEAWISEAGYDPAYDAAMRDWARISPEVEAAVHREDDRRIALIARIYDVAGFTGDDAMVRARIAYYHQVGYYAMRVRETAEQRRALKPLYKAALLPATR